MLIELIFDGGYLLTLWLLVFGLGQRLGRLEAPSQRCARPLVAAFALLGLVGRSLQDG